MRMKLYLLPLLAVIGFTGVSLAQTGEVEKPAVVSAVAPVYPAIAEAARASGDVTVEVEINREGKVTAANPKSEIKLLGSVDITI